MYSSQDQAQPSNPIVCSYHDCTLREKDIALTPAPNWLNDALISFYFEWLRQDAFDTVAASHMVLLIPPDTAFMLAALAPEESKSVLSSLQAETYRMVIAPVNDQVDLDAKQAGGSHWSTIVFVRDQPASAPEPGSGHGGSSGSGGAFYHLNSMEGSNDEAAHKAARGLSALVGARCHRVRNLKCPQQANGHDCGVCALAFAHCLCSAADHASDGAPVEQQPADEGSGRLRSKLKTLGQHLRHGSSHGADVWSERWLQESVKDVDADTMSSVRSHLRTLVESLRQGDTERVHRADTHINA